MWRREEAVAAEIGLRGVARDVVVADVALVAHLGEGVAKVLAHRPDVVDMGLELVADIGLVAAVAVDEGVAGVEPAADTQAERLRPDGTDIGQELGDPAGLVALEAREQREGRRSVRLISQARCDVVAVLRRQGDLRVRLLQPAGDPVEPVSRGIGRAANVEGGVDLVERSASDLDVPQWIEGRALRDDVDEAAHRAAAEQRGGGATQDLDALRAEGVDLVVGETRLEELQLVAVQPALGGRESADQEPVDPRVLAELVGEDAGRVAHGL